jgi:hypothetical protein
MMSPRIKHYGERVPTTAWCLRSTTSGRGITYMVVIGFVVSVVLPLLCFVLVLVPLPCHGRVRVPR